MEVKMKNCFILCVFLGFYLHHTDALSCYQCNIFIRGSPWPCNSERGMKEVHDCEACLKTFTRAYLHNTFHDEILTSYESRLCVKEKSYTKSAGCHNHETGSGYMKRCFCYDDYCNSSTSHRMTMPICAVSALLVSFLRYLF
ncbi:hypothetical protein ACF0H5_015664 [Mactra antiquata]